MAVLGVLKAGAAYLPLDVSYPRRRLSLMLEDASPACVLTSGTVGERLPSEVAAIDISGLDRRLPDTDPTDGERTCRLLPEHIAYIIYTSGSTGRPKGVAVTHRNVVRLLTNVTYAQLGRDRVMLQMSPTTFDAATFEVWGSLLSGGKLVVAPWERPAIADLESLLARERVTTLWLTAVLFHLIAREHVGILSNARQVIAGGDRLRTAEVRRVLETLPRCSLVNGYGPTEATTFSCCHAIGIEDRSLPSVPIGVPIANTEVYVLDARLNPVPVGVEGELYIAGAGVARGYAWRPAMTASRFVANSLGGPGLRMYRTGDIVRWNVAGKLEFLGRIDEQIKVRGYRVETGEIEAFLAAAPQVGAVAVAGNESATERRIVAYVTPAVPGAKLDIGKLQQFLQERLPSYMVPSGIMQVDSLPLTSSGKLDRAKLPPCDSVPPTKWRAPRTPTEETLCGLFAEILGVDRVGPDDSFFGLGGRQRPIDPVGGAGPRRGDTPDSRGRLRAPDRIGTRAR